MKKIVAMLGVMTFAASVSVFAADPATGGTAAEAAAPAAAPAEAAPAAEGGGDPTHDQFVKLDANADGSIDATEAKADEKLAKSFKKVAKKGKLDEAGYKKWASAK